MARTKVADEADLQDQGSKVIVDIEGAEIAVFNIEGEYYGLLNYCPHQSGPLCEGNLDCDVKLGEDGWTWNLTEERLIACPWHNWRFNVTDGQSVVTNQYSVPTYDVEVDDGEVYVLQ